MSRTSSFYAELQELFLDELRAHGNPTKAAKACGVTSATPKRLRRADSSFGEAWDAALDEFYDEVEHEAHRRAVTGWLEPVFYKGVVAGTVRKFSDTLMLAVLKGRRRAVYGERSQVEMTGKDGEPLLMSEAERAKRLAQLMAVAEANRKAAEDDLA